MAMEITSNYNAYESTYAAQNVYIGNKFLVLRKSEVAKVAPDRAVLMGKVDLSKAAARL